MDTKIFKLFKKFLIENGVFHQFYIYSIRRAGTREALLLQMKNANPVNWIIASFDWATTIEGTLFWNCANNQWTKIITRYINGKE